MDLHCQYLIVVKYCSMLFTFCLKVQVGRVVGSRQPTNRVASQFCGTRPTAHSDKVDIKKLWSLRQTGRKARMSYTSLLACSAAKSVDHMRLYLHVARRSRHDTCMLLEVACKWAGIHTVHTPAHVQHTMINLPTQPIHRCVEFKTRLPFIPHGHT